MDKKSGFSFLIIAIVIGFMLAVQIRTIQKPDQRDTRDMWELREDLKQSQVLYTELMKKIYTYEEKLDKYQTEQNDSKETVLRETLTELKREAGLTEVTGPGIILTIEQAFNEAGKPAESISPELLRRLINELNSYQAEEISIDGHRVINTTVIREIQYVTKIDSYPIRSLPIEIKVISKDAERLYNRMKASKSQDEFFIENLQLTVSKPINKLTVPPYDDQVIIKYMEPVKSEKGGKS